MRSSREKAHPGSADEPPPLVRWWSWPLHERLLTGMVVVAGILTSGVGVWWLTGKTHLGLLAAGALAVALWRFLVPVLFELSADGVNQWVFGRHRRIPWNEIRRFEIGSTGVLLLPHEDRCPMDSFRGLYLPWGRRRREVLAQIRYYLAVPMDG